MIKLALVAFIGIGFAAVATAAASDSIAECLTALEAKDAITRQKAVASFNDQLAKPQFKEYDDKLLPLIVKATSDEDAEVRRQGFGTLNLLSHLIVWSRLDSNAKVSAKLEDEPRLRPLIEKHLDDPNWEVREFALSAMIAYQPSADLKTFFISRWEKNKKQVASIKSGPRHDLGKTILDGIGAGNYKSKDVITFLENRMQDESAEIRGWAAYWLGHQKAPGELPRIIAMIKSDPEHFAKQQAIFGVGQYGQEAKPYLRDLEELEKATTDEVLKPNLSAVVRSLKQG